MGNTTHMEHLVILTIAFVTRVATVD